MQIFPVRTDDDGIRPHLLDAINAILEYDRNVRIAIEPKPNEPMDHAYIPTIGHALAIEKDYARLRELRDVLPAVGTIVSERSRVAESERKTERLTKDREKSVRSSESFVKLAMIHLMLNRLEPKETDAEFRFRSAA